MIAIDLYEPQVLALVVFASFFGLSAVVYIISIFTMKEKTYEQAIAEQRARLDKEQQQHRDQRQKRRQVFTRKKKEKVENNVSHPSPPPSPPSPPSPLVQEEVIKPKVEQQVAAPPPPAPQSKAKSPKQGKQPKAPQQQQQQPKVKAATKEAPAPAKEASSKKAPKEVPVKEAPMQKASAATTKAAPPPAKTQTSPKPTPKSAPKSAPKQKPVEEKIQKKEAPIVAQKTPESHAAPPPPPKKETSVPVQKEQSSPVKTKSKGARATAPPAEKTTGAGGDTVVDTGALKAKNLSAMLKTATLSNREVHQLVEVLLNKNGGSAATSENWVKANQRDPVQAMKKQLQEKEQALHNEMLLAQSSSQKVKELRAELTQEKSRRIQVESRYKETVNNHGRECDALRARMQQNHDTHTRDTQNLQTRIKQFEARTDSNGVEAVKQLRDENTQLKAEAGRNAQHFQNEVKKVESQMSANEGRIRQGEDQRRNMESKLAQYEQQIKLYEAGQAEQRENETALSKRLSEVSEELRKAEARVQTSSNEGEKTTERLQALNRENETVKKQLQEVYRLDSEKSNQMSAMEIRIRDNEKQKVNLEGAVNDSKAKLSETERACFQKDNEIKTLNDANSSLVSQLQAKTNELAQAVEAIKPNGDMGQEEIKEDTVLKKEHENIVNEKEKALAALQGQVSAMDGELETLKQKLEQQQLRNNKLQEKNWKAMEALSSAEKTSQEKVAKAVEKQKEDLNASLFKDQEASKGLLMRIFPDISVDTSLGHKDWLSQYEKNALNHLAVRKASTGLEVTRLSSKVSGLEDEKSQLVNQCQHYKSVLSDTEGILNKLQSSVESEEQKWQDKMSIKDTALAQTKKDLASMQEQTKQLDQLKQVSADNERLSSDLTKAQSRVNQMEKERSASATEYESTCRELKDVQNQLRQLMEELNTANQRVENSVDAGDMQKVKTTLAAEQHKSQKLSSDLEEANHNLQQLRKVSSNSQDILQHELQTLRSSSQQLQTELASTKQDLESTSQKLGQSTSQLQSSQQDLVQSRSELQELGRSQAQLAEAAEAASNMSKEKQETEQSLAASREELEASKKAQQEASEFCTKVQQDAEESTKIQQEEINTLKESLQKEKGLTKDLGTAAAKLQAMLKKTQSALVAEKQVVAELKAKAGVTDEQAEIDSVMTDSQVELQLLEAADDEEAANAKPAAKPADATDGLSDATDGLSV